MPVVRPLVATLGLVCARLGCNPTKLLAVLLQRAVRRSAMLGTFIWFMCNTPPHSTHLQGSPDLHCWVFSNTKTNPFFRREASNIKSLEQEDLCLICGFCKLG